ncbi:MAG: HK97 family phage prohead protease [Hyphomicrobiaceae bacterium]
MQTPPEAHFTALDLKSISDNGTFEGYASLFDREDLGRDIIRPGAFRETLAARGAGGIRMLFQHRPDEPIGVWTQLTEDHQGLLARGRLASDVARAREVLSLMRSGAIDGLSIGFRAVRAHRDRTTRRRYIEKVDLWEISIVTFPMLPDARIRSVKQQPFAGTPPSERELERWLTRDAGLTRSAARALLRTGHKGLCVTQDAGLAPSEQARLAQRLAVAAGRLRSTPHHQGQH